MLNKINKRLVVVFGTVLAFILVFFNLFIFNSSWNIIDSFNECSSDNVAFASGGDDTGLLVEYDSDTELYKFTYSNNNIIEEDLYFHVFDRNASYFNNYYISELSSSLHCLSISKNCFPKSDSYVVQVCRFVNSTYVEIKNAKKTLEISFKNASSISVNKDKLPEGFFTVIYADVVRQSGIKDISVDVWSDKEGVSKKKTYHQSFSPTVTSYSGSFDIPLSEHNYYLGVYNINLYVTTSEDIKDLDASLKSSIMYDFINLRGSVNNTCTGASVYIDGDDLPSVLEIQFLVSSLDSGKADGKWMASVKNNKTYWKGVDLTLYSRIGPYSVSAYIYNRVSGEKYFISEATFNVPAAKLRDVNAIEYDISGGCFTVAVDGVESVSGLVWDSIQVYVWSTENGQDDLKLYICNLSQAQDGTYNGRYRVFVSQHNFCYGSYNFLVYLKTANNFTGIVRGKQAVVDVGTSSMEASVDSTENNIHTILTNPNLSSNTSVHFGYYSVAKGVSDTRWVDAPWTKIGFVYDELISYHKALGNYKIIAYCTIANGSWKYLTTITFDYQTKATLNLTAPPEKIDSQKGIFNIQIDKINSPSGFWRVLLPTCSSFESIDSVEWHEPKWIGPGAYAVDIKVSDHMMSFGDYTTHAYIYMNNGVTAKISELITNIKPHNFIGVAYMGNGKYKAAAYNLDDTWINNIIFPTWSASGGKDDYREYQGVWISYNVWEVQFDIWNHWPAGKHFTEPVGSSTITGQKKVLGTIEYDVPESHFVGFPLYHGIRSGVDVSEWQREMSWWDIAYSNQVGYAFIRAGFGWAAMNGRADEWFDRNYQSSRIVGIPVGAYWYSYATNVAEAEAEARLCLSVLGGRYFDLPIAYDIEDAAQAQLDYNTRTAMINAFCRVIASAGYKPMVYASESWFNGMFNPYALDENIDFWVAKWSSVEPSVGRQDKVRFWQNSSSGSVLGIGGKVDTNWCYH